MNINIDIHSFLCSLNDSLTDKSTVKELWANSSGVDSGTITMNEAITNFRFLLINYRTNAQMMTKLVGPEMYYEIYQDASLFSGTGAQSDYAYKASATIKFTSTTQATVTTTYTNQNLKVRPYQIYGIMRVN